MFSISSPDATLFAALLAAFSPNSLPSNLMASLEFFAPTFAKSSIKEEPAFVNVLPPLISPLMSILGSAMSAAVPNIYCAGLFSIPRYFISSTPFASPGSIHSVLSMIFPAIVLGTSNA
ncbi:MAG: hypothetical protein BWY21_01739 [Parcubacteria group bacterium ADurb.Bin216]|nr:MAG: hypothetical protein BWY21_01739 [Parcubacteria group bacterium ADurb.Bin216]